MFGWLKQRLATWVEIGQQRQIDRLHRKAMRLKEEIEQSTGEPLQLTPEDLRLLAEKAKGIDPETLKKISVFDLSDFVKSESEIDSTENQN